MKLPRMVWFGVGAVLGIAACALGDSFDSPVAEHQADSGQAMSDMTWADCIAEARAAYDARHKTIIDDITGRSFNMLEYDTAICDRVYVEDAP